MLSIMKLSPALQRCFFLSVACFLAICIARPCKAGEEAAIEDRLREQVGYLASDELEGRGVGTKGIDLAADYLARQFKDVGLKTDLIDGSPFQHFNVVTSSKLGEPNVLKISGPPTEPDSQPRLLELKLGEQFTPLAVGGSGKLELPLVFVGYGITAKDENYDDYAGVNVEGKAVVVLRHEPQQDNPHSAFNATDHSQYAPFSRKISNAFEHGAAAVLFVTDDFDIRKTVLDHERRWQAEVDRLAEENIKFKAIEKPTDENVKQHRQQVASAVETIRQLADQIQSAADPLLGFEGAGSGSEGRNFPVLYVRRSAMDDVIRQALGKSLAAIEQEIDTGPTPQSRALEGWRALGETKVLRQEADVKNVIAVLEGDGPHANETVVVGAHYDHLGWGGPGSAAHGVNEIHNGADDNASGTVALVEVARQIAQRGKPPGRRLVFIAFTGEERGLLGSAHYMRNPLYPLGTTVAMLNMDMVGRLDQEKLIVHGTGTANVWDEMIDRLGKEYSFQITKKPGGFGPSDHSSFYAQKIPVLHLFTGTHSDYHRPSDDVEKLNLAGMRRVTQLVAQAAIELADGPQRPEYQETKGSSFAGGGGDRPYFGSIPDFAQDKPGYALSGVTKGGPAERAGLRSGDIIVGLGESKVGNLEDFDSALRKHKAGDTVPVTVQRGAESLTIPVTLDPPK